MSCDIKEPARASYCHVDWAANLGWYRSEAEHP